MKKVEAYLKDKITPGMRVVILGAGSELCADDAAGMLLVKKLERTLAGEERVLLAAGSTAPENFTGQIKAFHPDIIFFVDAAHLGKQPGSICPVPDNLIGGVSFSTHMLPFTVMLSYLQKTVNCEVDFIGIQPKSTRFGEMMCAEVAQAVDALAGYFSETILNS